MGQKLSVLDKVDEKSVSKFKDKCIQQNITTKLDLKINIAGVEFTDIEEAIDFAYRCGISAMAGDQSIKFIEGKGTVDQDELYDLLRKKGQSIEHKADFLREIAKEWFPIELHSEKKIKTVHLELIELAEYLEKE